MNRKKHLNRKQMTTLVNNIDKNKHRGMIHDTPILCKINDIVTYHNVSELSHSIDWEEDVITTPGVSVWSGKEWVDITALRRFKSECDIIQILTNNSMIFVTDNYQLTMNDEQVNCSTVKEGDVLDKIAMYPELTGTHDLMQLLISASNGIELSIVYNLLIRDGFFANISVDEQDGCVLEVLDEETENETKMIKNIGKTTEYVYQIETADDSPFNIGLGGMKVQ